MIATINLTAIFFFLLVLFSSTRIEFGTVSSNSLLVQGSSILGEVQTRAILQEFYDQTGGDNWRYNTYWNDPNASHCDFRGVTCGNSNQVIALSLHDNQLSGSIPESLGQLTSLTELHLGYNQLTGSIPESLGQLTSLTVLSLDNNQLSGIIPDFLGHLTSLTVLNLYTNQFTGSIPGSLNNSAKHQPWYVCLCPTNTCAMTKRDCLVHLVFHVPHVLRMVNANPTSILVNISVRRACQIITKLEEHAYLVHLHLLPRHGSSSSSRSPLLS